MSNKTLLNPKEIRVANNLLKGNINSMNKSGQQFCTALVPEYKDDYDAFKNACQELLPSSKNIAKLIVSSSETELIVGVYVPEELQCKLSPVNWLTETINMTDDIDLDHNIDKTMVFLKFADSSAFKRRDTLIFNSFNTIKKYGLYKVDEDVDDENDFSQLAEIAEQMGIEW